MAFADGVVPFGDPLADYYEGGPVDGTGYSRGIGEVTRDVEIAIIAGGYAAAARSRDVVTVSRWGRPGLKSGDWVMRGPANRWNYFWSGKWQPGMGNRFASFSSGQQFSVLKSTLRWPAGWGVDGWIKGLLGQRIYLP